MTKVVLVVAAHTDDEVLGCGGTIAKHVEEGHEVYVVFLADGLSSRPDVSIQDFAHRNAASEQAQEILGIKRSYKLSFSDNRMDSVPILEIVLQLECIVQEVQPHIVYTHHVGDLNVDHQITSKAVMTACRPQPGFTVREIYSFEVLSSTEWASPYISPFVPTKFVDITATFDRKIKALRAYHLEMRDYPHARSYENVEALARYRGCSVGLKYAEVFETIRLLG